MGTATRVPPWPRLKARDVLPGPRGAPPGAHPERAWIFGVLAHAAQSDRRRSALVNALLRVTVQPYGTTRSFAPASRSFARYHLASSLCRQTRANCDSRSSRRGGSTGEPTVRGFQTVPSCSSSRLRSAARMRWSRSSTTSGGDARAPVCRCRSALSIRRGTKTPTADFS